ncbi:MAG: 4-hydroxy-tetrahydrodipicolinate synthase [Desulfurella sp.]|uniref:4-hydroxy-tetrahydrodipicolinate synthase n=1 Tax=Desulfurella TaxID=33001 RepID=UPI000CC5E268|nr:MULTISPECIES: 4-hydroxy-tetrahydrodipicolinate synthase [Desulfurella]PMP66571.1 MAG: 4-hydroxy-tetrahydrodipicolinate synthase [Desulfurella multipotens]PMP89198.1 MAG: 4-hydroxy-tetrahydrodipicolinate synthase [Desulfurella sp.]HEX13304.1 4-hydroxy-tetrahydrodipicolinate synthase [Desulfurella acetivorans]
MFELKGAMTAIVTPFKNGKFDEVSFRNLIKRQIENGIDCIVPCGTTGEAVTLDLNEYEKVVGSCVEECKGQVGVLAGAGSNNTKKVIEMAKLAQSLGADAILSVTPYYNKPTQEGLYQHYKAIADAVDIGVVIYNVPGRTSVNILPDTVARLSEIDNIIGIKEASGSLNQVSEILEKAKEGFSVVSGDDFLTLPMLSIGGSGIISVTSNVAPAMVSEQYDAFVSGDLEKARMLHHKMYPLHQMMFIETNPIPVKTAVALMGLVEEEFRLPLCKMSSANKEKLKAMLKEYEFLGG